MGFQFNLVLFTQAAAPTITSSRITSYNVCYTKLLRARENAYAAASSAWQLKGAKPSCSRLASAPFARIWSFSAAMGTSRRREIAGCQGRLDIGCGKYFWEMLHFDV